MEEFPKNIPKDQESPAKNEQPKSEEKQESYTEMIAKIENLKSYVLRRDFFNLKEGEEIKIRTEKGIIEYKKVTDGKASGKWNLVTDDKLTKSLLVAIGLMEAGPKIEETKPDVKAENISETEAEDQETEQNKFAPLFDEKSDQDIRDSLVEEALKNQLARFGFNWNEIYKYRIKPDAARKIARIELSNEYNDILGIFEINTETGEVSTNEHEETIRQLNRESLKEATDLKWQFDEQRKKVEREATEEEKQEFETGTEKNKSAIIQAEETLKEEVTKVDHNAGKLIGAEKGKEFEDITFENAKDKSELLSRARIFYKQINEKNLNSEAVEDLMLFLTDNDKVNLENAKGNIAKCDNEMAKSKLAELLNKCEEISGAEPIIEKEGDEEKWQNLKEHYRTQREEIEKIIDDPNTPDDRRNELIASLEERTNVLDSSVLESFRIEKNKENEEIALHLQSMMFNVLLEKYKKENSVKKKLVEFRPSGARIDLISKRMPYDVIDLDVKRELGEMEKIVHILDVYDVYVTKPLEYKGVGAKRFGFDMMEKYNLGDYDEKIEKALIDGDKNLSIELIREAAEKTKSLINELMTNIRNNLLKNKYKKVDELEFDKYSPDKRAFFKDPFTEEGEFYVEEGIEKKEEKEEAFGVEIKSQEEIDKLTDDELTAECQDVFNKDEEIKTRQDFETVKKTSEYKNVSDYLNYLNAKYEERAKANIRKPFEKLSEGDFDNIKTFFDNKDDASAQKAVDTLLMVGAGNELLRIKKEDIKEIKYRVRNSKTAAITLVLDKVDIYIRLDIDEKGKGISYDVVKSAEKIEETEEELSKEYNRIASEIDNIKNTEDFRRAFLRIHQSLIDIGSKKLGRFPVILNIFTDGTDKNGIDRSLEAAKKNPEYGDEFMNVLLKLNNKKNEMEKMATREAIPEELDIFDDKRIGEEADKNILQNEIDRIIVYLKTTQNIPEETGVALHGYIDKLEMRKGELQRIITNKNFDKVQKGISELNKTTIEIENPHEKEETVNLKNAKRIDEMYNAIDKIVTKKFDGSEDGFMKSLKDTLKDILLQIADENNRIKPEANIKDLKNIILSDTTNETAKSYMNALFDGMENIVKEQAEGFKVGDSVHIKEDDGIVREGWIITDIERENIKVKNERSGQEKTVTYGELASINGKELRESLRKEEQDKKDIDEKIKMMEYEAQLKGEDISKSAEYQKLLKQRGTLSGAEAEKPEKKEEEPKTYGDLVERLNKMQEIHQRRLENWEKVGKSDEMKTIEEKLLRGDKLSANELKLYRGYLMGKDEITHAEIGESLVKHSHLYLGNQKTLEEQMKVLDARIKLSQAHIHLHEEIIKNIQETNLKLEQLDPKRKGVAQAIVDGVLDKSKNIPLLNRLIYKEIPVKEEIKEQKEFKTGQEVRVKEGEELETGWKITKIEGSKVTVEKEGAAEKTVKENNLKVWNGNRKENFKKDEEVNVIRTNGEVEKGWKVKEIKKGKVTITKEKTRIEKTVNMKDLVSWQEKDETKGDYKALVAELNKLKDSELNFDNLNHLSDLEKISKALASGFDKIEQKEIYFKGMDKNTKESLRNVFEINLDYYVRNIRNKEKSELKKDREQDKKTFQETVDNHLKTIKKLPDNLKDFRDAMIKLIEMSNKAYDLTPYSDEKTGENKEEDIIKKLDQILDEDAAKSIKDSDSVEKMFESVKKVIVKLDAFGNPDAIGKKYSNYYNRLHSMISNYEMNGRFTKEDLGGTKEIIDEIEGDNAKKYFETLLEKIKKFIEPEGKGSKKKRKSRKSRGAK